MLRKRGHKDGYTVFRALTTHVEPTPWPLDGTVGKRMHAGVRSRMADIRSLLKGAIAPPRRPRGRLGRAGA